MKMKLNFSAKVFLLILLSLTFYLSPFSCFAQVSINSTGANPDASAGLDVSFTDKGLLIPRVALTQTTSSSPITSPATSLLVYNTATINDVTPGYYYWNGSRWVRIAGNGACNTANYVLKSNGTDATCSQIFDNGTNVGIGTTNPITKLEVQGNILASNGYVSSANTNTWANHDIFVAAITEHPSFVGLRARGTLASPVYPSTNDILLTVTGRDMIDGYNGYGGNLNAFGGGSIEFRAEENFSGTNKGTYITFNTTNIGSNIQTEKMRITANGFVGIGTNAPNAKLDIKGIGNNNSSYGLGVRNSSDNYSFVVRDDGFVGIGVVSPLYKLHVYNGVIAQENSSGLQYVLINNDGGLELYRHASSTVNPICNGYIDFKNLTTDDFRFRIYWNYSLASNTGGLVFASGTPGQPNTESQIMTILNNGYVGINKTNPIYELDVNGNVAAYDYYSSSDKRLKKEIKPIQSSLKQVLKLNPVTYKWDKENFPEKKFKENTEIGFIAQEVELLFPEIVNTDKNGYKAMDYAKLSVILTKAIQEQQAEIEELKNINEKLNSKVELLLNEINKLKAEKNENY